MSGGAGFFGIACGTLQVHDGRPQLKHRGPERRAIGAPGRGEDSLLLSEKAGGGHTQG